MQVFVTQQYLAIAMEYAAGGDMFEHVVRKGGLKESEARWFFQQLLVGVDYVHRMVSFRHQQVHTNSRCPLVYLLVLRCHVLQNPPAELVAPALHPSVSQTDYIVFLQGVANRDIKLENTLLDGSPRPLLKICDFGYSKVRFAAIT